ncbi:hypothetical protein V5O48_017790 [Marasmius crinis-equi]|uniref:Uncharacterized protein n=1 Tax=Marasmius crinis-equi TaxID=585013 RepID=A0ABR3EN06_9AGAR
MTPPTRLRPPIYGVLGLNDVTSLAASCPSHSDICKASPHSQKGGWEFYDEDWMMKALVHLTYSGHHETIYVALLRTYQAPRGGIGLRASLP